LLEENNLVRPKKVKKKNKKKTKFEARKSDNDEQVRLGNAATDLKSVNINELEKGQDQCS